MLSDKSLKLFWGGCSGVCVSVCVHLRARVGVDYVSSRGDRGHSETGIRDLALFSRHSSTCVILCILSYMFVLEVKRRVFQGMFI